MEGNGSYGTSWADQWDPSDSHPAPQSKKSGGGGGASATDKYKKKFGEGLVKTKAVTLTGMKKVKQGTTVGFQWMKDKYQKTTQKH